MGEVRSGQVTLSKVIGSQGHFRQGGEEMSPVTPRTAALLTPRGTRHPGGGVKGSKCAAVTRCDALPTGVVGVVWPPSHTGLLRLSCSCLFIHSVSGVSGVSQDEHGRCLCMQVAAGRVVACCISSPVTSAPQGPPGWPSGAPQLCSSSSSFSFSSSFSSSSSSLDLWHERILRPSCSSRTRLERGRNLILL